MLRGIPREELAQAFHSTGGRPDDPVQTALEAYLGGATAEPELLDAANLSAVLQVERWTGEGAGSTDVSAIKARLDWLVLTQPLRRLLVQGFFGRQDLLRECRSFVTREMGMPPDLFLIEGGSGTGKSTVLAKLILDLPGSDDLAAYVNLDRGWILAGGGRAIFDEIVRQVGLQIPGKAVDASRLRRQVQRQTGRATGYPDPASRRSHSSETIDPEMIESLKELTHGHRRLIVALDTMEELARRDHAIVSEIARLLTNLSGLMPRVRIIAAGRTLPELFFGRSRRLAGLGKADALAMLRALTSGRVQSEDAMNEIVGQTDGNPFRLRLAADVLSRADGDPQDVIVVASGNVQRAAADARRAASVATLDLPGAATGTASGTTYLRSKGRPGRKPKGSVPVVIPETPDRPDPDHVLTWRQRKVLQVIRESVQQRGYPPSMREIGEAVGLTSTSSVSHQLSTLQKKGTCTATWVGREP